MAILQVLQKTAVFQNYFQQVSANSTPEINKHSKNKSTPVFLSFISKDRVIAMHAMKAATFLPNNKYFFSTCLFWYHVYNVQCIQKLVLHHTNYDHWHFYLFHTSIKYLNLCQQAVTPGPPCTPQCVQTLALLNQHSLLGLLRQTIITCITKCIFLLLLFCIITAYSMYLHN